ncbi:MAG TPA: response regulator [Thermomicrobiales bacterium]|jgi:two-component system cell cycle response regulator|nr:response regulator [Thermomicrobiales bacterium]
MNTAQKDSPHGRVMIVDDSELNRRLLHRYLQREGYETVLSHDGVQALAMLREPSTSHVDVVLLDVMMPHLDGYEVLSAMKRDPHLAHLPVIMITAVDDIESVVRCIELGAMDYLPKPFNAAILRARINSSLVSKRLRDMELEYLEQVGRVTEAAAALEAGSYTSSDLDIVALRSDALGQLARVFRTMADEVQAREERLKMQVRELQIEIDEGRQARKVAEITDSDFFQSLKGRADNLRKILEAPQGTGRKPAGMHDEQGASTSDHPGMD